MRDFKAAGVRAGVSEAAARRAYNRGWPGIDAIAGQLAKERALHAQSAEVLKAERMVGTLKTNAMSLQGEMRRLYPAVRALTDNLLGSLDHLGVLQPESAVKALQRITKVHKDVAAITAKSVELDRLLAGEATSIVGHKAITADEPLDLEAAQAELDGFARALRRAQSATGPAATADAADTKDTDVDISTN